MHTATRTLMDKASAEVKAGSKVSAAKDWIVHQVWGATGHQSWGQALVGGLLKVISGVGQFLLKCLPFGGHLASVIALAEKPAVEAVQKKMALKRLGSVNSDLAKASPNLAGLGLRVEQMKLGQQIKVKELPESILNDLYDIRSRFEVFTKAVQETDQKLKLLQGQAPGNTKGIQQGHMDVTKGCYGVAHSYYDLAQKVMTLRQDLDILKVWLADLDEQAGIFEAHVVGYSYETEELLDDYFNWSKPH